ncbi:MAG: S46 family peptidase [Candidatus Neomarinimicrobiota bacterium]
MLKCPPRCYFILLFCTVALLSAEEGMWPLSDLPITDLQAAGLELAPADLYNPDGVSLIDGICKVNGCSGSFVSEQGLILTNHHCAFRAIQDASTPQRDYLEQGFLARTKDEEVIAKGYTVKITESYRDVSGMVLAAVTAEMTPAERTQAIEKRINEIETAAEKPGTRAEVAEMFPGKSYVLFISTQLKDVRLVYAPPQAIGNYGGETDNWVWPRHTGDFSFLRAYVGPDGKPAEYSPDNIPYQPRKVLEIAIAGVDEEDFVFILGYPGRTYRHRTSYYLDYEYSLRMPAVVDLYQWQIAIMETIGGDDRSVILKQVSRIKNRSNSLKNYRGKLLGIGRLDLVEKRWAGERELQQYIAADSILNRDYGRILPEIGAIYRAVSDRADYEFCLNYLKDASVLLHAAYVIYTAAAEKQKPDSERETAFTERRLDETFTKMYNELDNFYQPTDQVLLLDLLRRCRQLPEEYQIPAISALPTDNDGLQTFVESALENSRLGDPRFVESLLGKTPVELALVDDLLLQFMIALHPSYEEQRAAKDARDGRLDVLHAALLEVQRQFHEADFIPDANSTLRLTYGHVRGYAPADAVYYAPITTLNGVISKNSGEPPFNLPPEIVRLQTAKDFGRYRHPRLNSVPVALLYNMDTTGGNSGAAVLNARGQLVGVNFDRAFEATINDFAWNEAYSRSIAVDIRYVLWIAEKFSGADELLQELGLAQATGKTSFLNRIFRK